MVTGNIKFVNKPRGKIDPLAVLKSQIVLEFLKNQKYYRGAGKPRNTYSQIWHPDDVYIRVKKICMSLIY